MRFKLGQRVIVRAVGEYEVRSLSKPAAGTVVRLRRADDGAWVRLDERHADEWAHPFDRFDSRANHVITYPEDCEAVRIAKVHP